MTSPAIGAIVRRELTSYLASPTAYVFTSIFIFLSAVAAFWQPEFFAANLANLDLLNRVFPYLLVLLVPAITMGLWADERRHGTEELLLTLPASDLAIVVGKYLAALAVYTMALILSLSHVVVLSWLGDPDPGLMVATYTGYWLMGAALLTLGLTASLVTENLTVSFILGAALCAIPVSLHHAEVFFAGTTRRVLDDLSVARQFAGFAEGVVTPAAVLYFVLLAAAVLYLDIHLLGRRRWPTGRFRARPRLHLALRGVSLAVIVGSLTFIAGHARLRLDVTSEQIHSLSPETHALLRDIDPARPVFIHAYVSPEVPDAYMETRSNLLALLGELDATAGDRLHVRVLDTVKYSPEAREARDRFDIRATAVPASQESRGAPHEIYLGVAFACGSREFVIPFLDRGLPVEYELVRSMRVVAQTRRRKVGILTTGINVFGGYDFKDRRQAPEWSIVAELRKQYDVVSVAAHSDYPGDLDALLAPQPSTLSTEDLARLTAYVQQGHPTLLLLDPLPAFDLDLAPNDPPSSPLGPAPTRPPRADLRPLLHLLGIDWPRALIAWDKENPHPQLRNLPPEVVFAAPEAGAASGEEPTFNPKDPTTAGLQEVVFIYPGVIRPIEAPDAPVDFEPLIRTGADSGTVSWRQLVQPSLFGISIAPNVRHEPDKETHVLAARIEGTEGDPQTRVHAIVVADTDLMGEQFFELRRRGVEQLRFDNVTFLLNAVDSLAGDESMIELRKRRPRHRRLEAVEARTRVYEERRLADTRGAEAFAQRSLEDAQKRVDDAVEQLRRRTDLDEQTRAIMIRNLQQVENRRLAVTQASIKDERDRRIEASREDMEASVRSIQNAIKLAAVLLPPVPALLLFLLVSVRRLRRESIGASTDRLLDRHD